MGGSVWLLRFVHDEARDGVYALYYDLAGKYAGPFPREIPMVGNGDRLRVGLKGSVSELCSSIAGVFDVCDIDGDGDYDLWLNGGTAINERDRDLMIGHYYYENISSELGQANVFAPGQLIKRGNTLTGYVSGNIIPDICDVNCDGRLDVLMLGRIHEWWEWELRGGQPVVTAVHELEFTGKPPKAELKSIWFDWDNDGLKDILVGELPDIPNDELSPVVRVFRNVGDGGGAGV